MVTLLQVLLIIIDKNVQECLLSGRSDQFSPVGQRSSKTHSAGEQMKAGTAGGFRQTRFYRMTSGKYGKERIHPCIR